MKLGIVVDGVSEYASLGGLYGDLRGRTGNQFLTPVKANIQPNAPLGVIARQCIPKIKQVQERGADCVLVLFDREERADCPGDLADSVQAILASNGLSVRVVVKNRKFENWLMADLEAFEAMAARFEISKATRRAIQPNKADNVDALALLKRATRGDSYHKVEDSKRILAKAQVSRMAGHSRSFRRFLRVAGDSAYQHQSANP